MNLSRIRDGLNPETNGAAFNSEASGVALFSFFIPYPDIYPTLVPLECLTKVLVSSLDASNGLLAGKKYSTVQADVIQ